MAIVTHQSLLPDESSKADVYGLVDNASVGGITNDDIASDTVIDGDKFGVIKRPGKINFSSLIIDGQTVGDILYSSDGETFIRLPIGEEGQKLVAGVIIDNMEYSSDVLAQAAYVPSGIATGGTITYVGGQIVHTFNSSGTFTPNVAGNVDVVVVGGGGGGASTQSNCDGGGGGGQVNHNSSLAVTAQAYSVTVGGGGGAGTDGQSSVFSSITSIGGKHGNGTYGGNSGSGMAGGTSTADEGTSKAGGGGGDSSIGGNGTGAGGKGGNGGVGTSVNGVAYGGGGGGGSEGGGSGGGSGNSGGGNGSTGSGTAGTANTGGGGGGRGSSGTSGAGGSGVVVIRYTPIMQIYSDSTNKTQGSYSIRLTANATDSLNKTFTKTVSPVIDLSNINTLKFDIYSSRTGSNIKIGIHDSGGTTTEITPDITDANTWQTVTWDISAVSNADKNAIDRVIVTIVNADAVNTFYLDNFNSKDLRWVTVGGLM